MCMTSSSNAGFGRIPEDENGTFGHFLDIVRELKNVIQRTVLLCDGEELRPEHFPARLRTAEAPSTLPVISFNIGTPLEEVERALIRYTLEVVDNNRTEAAKLLGISRRALYNRLRKYQIA